jgi:type IV pilus assembly protein PilY1
MKIVIALILLTFSAGVCAQELQLSRVPPSIDASVAPNVLVTLDDSGSMGFGYMPDTVGSYTDCRYYDPAINKIYYNPNATYTPPLRADGSSFPNANYSAAWNDGFLPDRGTTDLANDYRVTHEATKSSLTANPSFDFRTSGFPSGVSETYGCNWFGTGCSTRQRAFFCEGNSVRLMKDRSAADRQNFANWFSYYRTRSLAARTALSRALADPESVDRTVRVARQNLNQNHIGSTTEIKALSNTSWRNAFFDDWLFRSPYNSGTPTRAALGRAGEFFTRSSSNERNPYWDVDVQQELSCRQNFHIMVTDGYTNETSVPGSVSGIGNYDNVGRTFPDGKSLGGADGTVYTNVPSGGNLSPNAPNMADIAMYYWGRDLRTNLDNNVPPYIPDRAVGRIPGSASEESEIYFNPANDPATWQRMVNFFVTFGVGGTRTFDTSASCVDDYTQTGANICQSARLLRLRRGLDAWPAVNNNNPTAIDDTWHAAVNSRGEYLSASDPQELVNQLVSVLDSVTQRQGVTGSAGSSAFARADALEFEASYDSGSWSGDLNAFRVNTDGTQGSSAWANGSAANQLDGRTPGSRTIFTSTGGPNATRVEFNWGALTPEHRAALSWNPISNAADTLGDERVAWIRGARDEEQAQGGPLRNRTSVLGPFIGSGPISVSAPRFDYRGRHDFPEGGSSYAQYRLDNLNRATTVYIGGNDGMLHAFDGLTGAERWAFIPNRVVRNLSRLMVPGYQFVPFVNNTPVTHDVYFDGAWRTVLIGTLGLGGQGVYALDVTNPNSPRVLWEFSDENDARLGYTYSQANVGRLSDGSWVAFVGSGYNSDADRDFSTRGLPNRLIDEHVGNGDSVVFAINVASGAAKAIPVPGAVGLATPQLADYELDYKVDFLVSGDLNGELWRVDLSGRTWANIGDARGEKMFDGSPTQPITSAPTIFADAATGKLVVVAGTGKYLEDEDKEINIPRQVIYGIRECGAACAEYPIVRSELVEQTITAGAGTQLTMGTAQVVPRDKNGWFIQLGNPTLLGGKLRGERVINMPVGVNFASGIVAVGSYIPSNDPCAPLGSSAIYALSASTGGYVFGATNANGTTIDAVSEAFQGTSATTIGMLSDRPGMPSAYINPQGGTMLLDGVTLNGVPIRRRSGWREIPVE